MPIDPNIAMGYRPPQFESPVNQMAAVMQLQGAQQANELNRQKMDEYKRAREMEGERRNALAGIDLNAPDSYNTVAQRLFNMGDLEGAKKILTDYADLQHKRAQTTKEQATAEKTGVETKVEKLKLYRDQLPILAENPTDEAIVKWAKFAVQNDLMDFTAAKAGIDAYLKLPPAERSQKLRLAALSAEKGLKQHYMQVNSGDKTTIIGMPEYGTGAPRVVREDKINLSPDQRARIGLERERLNKDIDPRNVAQTITDKAGNVTLLNKRGEVISTLEGKGKPSATFEKTESQKKQLDKDANIVISELEKATKDGGLIDQSTGSGAGAIYDASARFFGNATKGDIAIGQLKPIADLALKMVPRFEGAQSNADVISYTAAAGQLADPTLPNEIRKAAGKEVLRIMKKRKGEFGRADMESGNAPPAGFVVDN